MASSSPFSFPTPLLHQISTCFIKPETSIPEEELSKTPIYLNKSDLSQLCGSYHTSGLLFSKPSSLPSNDHIHEQQTPPVVDMNTTIETLKDSLSKVLVHFYPLACRLKTHKQDSDYYIYIDCSNPQGAEFVHASTDLTLHDILSPVDVPTIVESFFLYNGAVNHDGHTLPLLGVQVTELIDGYFIGCSFNHAVGDGTSFWHFLNIWSEISSSKGTVISNPPVLKRWFLEGHDSIIKLPYSAPEDFIDRYTPKPLRVRVFHFSAESMSRLECKANQDSSSSSSSSSSFQSLCALLWKCVTRARGIPSDEISRCFINTGEGAVMGTAEVGKLLNHDVGWSALLLNKAIDTYNSEQVRKKAERRIESSPPTVRNVARIMDGRFLLIGSLKYDVYGIDFGWGKPVSAYRGIFGFDGKITAFPGREGGTSIDLVCRLSSETLSGLESDEEFMSFVSPPTTTTIPYHREEMSRCKNITRE